MWRLLASLAVAVGVCGVFNTQASSAAQRGPATPIYDSTGVPGQYVYAGVPALAFDSDTSRVLAVWGVSASEWGGALVARMLDASGRPLGEAFVLPGFDWVGDPSVVTAGNGRFVVGGVTVAADATAISTIAVTAGGIVGSTNQIAPPVGGVGAGYSGVSLAADPRTSRVEAVWFRSRSSESALPGLALGRRLGASGRPAAPIRVLLRQTPRTVNASGFASVTFAPALRSWVVAIARGEDRPAGCFIQEVRTRLLDPSGSPRGPARRVARRTCGSRGPAVITWSETKRQGLVAFPQYHARTTVWAVPLGAQATRVGPAHRVDVRTSFVQGAFLSSLVGLPDGGAVVSYVRSCDPVSPSESCPRTESGVVQRLDPQGRRVGHPTRVVRNAGRAPSLIAVGDQMLLGWRRFQSWSKTQLFTATLIR